MQWQYDCCQLYVMFVFLSSKWCHLLNAYALCGAARSMDTTRNVGIEDLCGTLASLLWKTEILWRGGQKTSVFICS